MGVIICPKCGCKINRQSKRKKRQLNDLEYSMLLNDYKDKIIDLFYKSDYNIVLVAVEWNCDPSFMKKKLVQWGVIDINENLLQEITKEMIIDVYKETRNLKEVAKRFHVSKNYIDVKVKELQIGKLIYNENDRYTEIINNKELLDELMSFCSCHNKKDTAEKFKISVYYINKILAGGVCRIK